MSYSAVIALNLDILHKVESHPAEFGNLIVDSIRGSEGKPSFRNSIGYINVHGLFDNHYTEAFGMRHGQLRRIRGGAAISNRSLDDLSVVADAHIHELTGISRDINSYISGIIPDMEDERAQMKLRDLQRLAQDTMRRWEW